MPSNFVELAILGLLPNQSLHSLSFTSSLQKILNTLSSTPGALTFQSRRSVSPTSTQLLLAIWTDRSAHDYLDVHGIAPKLLKEMFTRVKPEIVHFMDLDVGQLDLDAGVLGVDIFHAKDGKRLEFDQGVKKFGRVGGWYVFKGVPAAPMVMPNDERELEIIRMQKERAEKAMGEKVPDVWVGISDSAGEAERDGFRHRTKDLVETCVSGRWEKFFVGKKDTDKN
ncbi:hypothetical protein BKA64DRAFT_663104 [Cadophora sp. MPI-SDFR-AT-0126]|nr:hypothetical protein BKA64DRAFT_663104 [Leotiomycetes sp. MPI-SDFR-AT-0126]